ncbi:phosphopantetheine-binding protein, partial [Streptomyces sp. NPDC058954]|uniref:phosphopantetheine-binding protein n=1 Tax=Streptomyces sp. NPDC058954 TaxID=3346677 RepID=UPI00367A4A1A
TLRRHPHINNAVITKWEPTPGDHRLAAYITLDSTAGTTQAELLTSIDAHLADQLPIYMIPSSITVLDRIPTNANGKTDLHALPEPRVHDGEKAQLPRTEAERLVAGVWAEVLGRDDLDVTANFYALGGHSLLATRIVSRLRAALNTDIPLALIFDNPTIQTMANALDSLLPTSGVTDERTPS